MKIAIQGNKGSYSHQCAQQLYNNFELIECKWFDEVFEKLSSGEVDLAVVPVENAIAGTVTYTYDELIKHPDLYIIDEAYLRIKLALITKPEVNNIAELQHVISHPMAIRQATNFIKANQLLVKEFDDTAGSVKEVMQNDEKIGAIASSFAAEMYKAKVLVDMIEDNEANFTRFWVITKNPSETQLTEEYKVSIVFETSHEPGALTKVLNIFANANLNLTKLESRPIVGKVWKYYFYCDFVTTKSNDYVERVMEIVRDNVEMLRVLGYYKKANL